MPSYQPAGSDARRTPETKVDGREGYKTRSYSYGTIHGIESAEDERLELGVGRFSWQTLLARISRPRIFVVFCTGSALLAAAIVVVSRSRQGPATVRPGVSPPVTATCVKSNVIWADEFDGTDLDLTKWSHQEGDGCDIGLCAWGNAELEWYSKDNLRIEDGHLVMEARREDIEKEFSESAGEGETSTLRYRYTSSKILTRGNGDFGPVGRFEARMRLPRGNGIWPAFWMLPTDDVYGAWPKSGEIDIMENIGKEGPNTIHGEM
mmetsp:Transcript_21465/g.62827  ORF Transcript_21465/g.62827 Transcript_21465/m.62827 type:complete len:264 (-) Transcript_21465:229-1020(-)